MADRARRRVARRRRTPAAAGYRRSRAGAAGLLGAAVVGAAVASAGMVITGAASTASTTLSPAAVVAHTPAGPRPLTPGPAARPPAAAPAGVPQTPEQDVEFVAQPKAVAFLAALRKAKIPTSRSGLGEVLVARAACAELANGTSESDLARRIPSGLPTVTKSQAATLVKLARANYC